MHRLLTNLVFSSHVIYAALMVVFFSCAQLVDFAEATITTNPTALVAQMPFYVYTDDVSVTSVFVARQSSCASSSMIGTQQGISAPQYSALFHFPSETATTLYLCQYLSGSPLTTLSFTRMTFAPQFFIRANAQTVQFSSNVPVSTRALVREFQNCQSGATAVDTTLSPSRTITATTVSSFNYFMCVAVVSAATGQVVTINLGQVVSTDRGNVVPSTALKNEIDAIFEVGGTAPPGTRVIIAPDASCQTILQGPVTTGGTFGKSFNITVAVDRGTYMFCTENPLNSNIYIPSDTPLTVQAYTISPLTIFANQPVVFTFGGDIPDSFRLGWSTTGCVSPTWLKTPITVTGRTLTETFTLGVGQTGYTVSSCIYNNVIGANPILGANHAVVQPYTASINRPTNDVVRGLSLSVTVSPHPTIFVSLHMGIGCGGTTFASGNASNFVFSTLVPLAMTAPGSMTICLRTLDGSATYAVRNAIIRNFILGYDVAVTGLPTFFTIDSALSVGALVTPAYKFTIGNMDCNGIDAGFGVLSPTPNATLTFSTTNAYTFCARTYNVDFVPITVVQSYTQPFISPNATLIGVSSVIEVFNVPVGLTAVIGQTCDRATADQTQVRSSTLNSVPFTVQYNTAGFRLICVYFASANSSTAPFIAGNLTISALVATPTRAFQGQLTRFNIVTTLSPPYLLMGSFAYVTTAGPVGCTTSSAETPTAVNYNNGRPFVNLQVPIATGTIGICVGGNFYSGNAFVYAGSVSVIPGLVTTFNPPTPVVNIPFSITFSGSFFPNSFIVASESTGCEVPIIDGPLVGGSTTSPVTITSSGSYVICVEADPPGSYLVAATITMDELQANPSTYVRLTSTFFGTTPALPSSSTSLFLTSAVDCTGPRWFASAASPLQAPVGTYSLCALFSNGGGADSVLAIAKNRVTVIDAYRLTLPTVPPPIRSFIPFVISLLGGDVATAGSASVFFIPRYAPVGGRELFCYNTSTTSSDIVSRFNSTTPSAMSVFIPAKENVPYLLCARTRDGSSAVALATITPESYISPTVVIKGVTSTITSGAMRNGLAIIAQNEDCSGTRYAGPIQVANYLMDNFVVSGSVLGAIGYYCESVSTGFPYAYRAAVELVPLVTLPPLPAPSTYPPTTPIGFDDRTVPPATPIVLQVPPEMGSNPFVSYFRNCSKIVEGITTAGYIPAELESADFYVCARAPNGLSNYSMPTPNLHISKYAVSPTSSVSASVTVLALRPSAATTNAWFSSNVACPADQSQVGSESYLGAAVDFTTGFQSISTTYAGIVYICVLDTRVITVDPSVRVFAQIASLLSVGSPVLAPNSATNPIQGIPWCLFRTVPKSLYTLVEGADASSPYARYYTTTKRDAFIVASASVCSVGNALTAPVSQVGSETAALCIPTAGLPNGSYTVCSGTPAGYVRTITATMTIADPHPSAWIAGTNTLTLFPNMPLRSFLFVPSGRSCSIANAASSPFTTNSSSYAVVSTFTLTGNLPIAPGTYTLCAKVDQDNPNSQWTSVKEGLLIARQQVFSLDVTTVTAGVATTVPLGGDLTVGVLRATLSPAVGSSTGSRRYFADSAVSQSDATSFVSPCQTELPTAAGKVEPVANETSVNATHAVITIPSAGRYVICALTAVNNTMVPVATITVVAPVVSFAGTVAACDLLTVMYPSVGAAANTQTTDMFLTSSLCCTPNATVGSSSTLAVIPRPATGASFLLRTVSVTDDQLFSFAPTTEFSLCVSNATFCVGAGYVDFVGSICAVTTLTPNPTSNNNGSFVGGAATGWTLGRDDIPITLLVIFFCLLLCCLIIIAIICCCRRYRKVVPKDEDAGAARARFGDDPDAIEMMGSPYRRNKRAKSAPNANDDAMSSTIAVPMDMGLFICAAPPVGAQIMENDEGRYRAIIEHHESEERNDLYSFFARAESDILAEEVHTRSVWEQERRDREERLLAEAARDRSERRAREEREMQELEEAREREAFLAMRARELEEEERRRIEREREREIERERQLEIERRLISERERERERLMLEREIRLSEISAMFSELLTEEESMRLYLEENEDTVRLNVAEMEREMWRYNMEREGQMLHDRLEATHFQTQSRRRKLREANDRAFRSINETAAQLQLQQQQQQLSTSHFSGDMASPNSGVNEDGRSSRMMMRRSLSPIRSRMAGEEGPTASPFYVTDEPFVGTVSQVGRSSGGIRYEKSAPESPLRSPRSPREQRLSRTTNPSSYNNDVPDSVAVSLDTARPTAVLVNSSRSSYQIPHNNNNASSSSSSVYVAPPTTGYIPSSALRASTAATAAERSGRQQLSPLRSPAASGANSSFRRDPNMML